MQSRQVGFFNQIAALLHKRFIILLRAPLAELAFFAIPLIVAGACNTFLSSAHNTITCDVNSRFSKQKYSQTSADVPFDFPLVGEQEFLAAAPGYNSFLQGQASWAQDPTTALELINATVSSGLHFLNSFDEFYGYIEANYSQIVPGGLSLSNNPTLAYQADSSSGVYYGPLILNLFTNLLVNGSQTIIANYSPFQISWVTNTGNVLQFITYFGLSLAVAPAFAGLYPTFERLSKVRAMQYSNGLRVVPLWTAYLLFDMVLIVVLSAICLGIIMSAISGIYGPGYLFLVFMLYLTTASLLSFVVSLFVQSQLAAFAVVAAYEAVFVLIYLIGYLTTQTFGHPATIERNVRIIYFTVAAISPSQSLMRSLFIAFNIFGILCGSQKSITYMGDILAYGGPVLYLIVQICLLFGFLIWWESGLHRRMITHQFQKLGKIITKLFHTVFKPRDWNLDSQDPLDTEEKTADNNALETEVLQEERFVEENLDRYASGLALVKISKEYGGKRVVDDISFGVERGECFALLGPNGAGKTTTFNMVRGEVAPTQGDVLVTGISVTRERAVARTRLGVCPQFDAMDKLSVEEVLHFYARLRGVYGQRNQAAAVQAHVDRLIVSVDLDRFRTRMASKLSGGNKRKLSLAVALIGNPSVLLLDEPSSGMDAFAKRLMWRTLAAVAPGRATVLTTHSMEEADALAGRAGILARKMRALGTVAHLRGRYGDVVHVHIVCRDAPLSSIVEMKRVVEIIGKLFPGSQSEDRMYQGQVKVAVPLGSGFSVARVFQVLEEHKDQMGIRSYSVFPTRLEEVFLKIVGNTEEEEEASTHD